MTGDDWGYALYGLLAMALVASGFAARKIPVGQTAKMALGWVAIFGLAFVAMSFRHDLGDLFSSRVLGRAIVEGGTVRIPMADDGHFYIDARINGAVVRLMVDSGATMTTLSRSTAATAGIAPSDRMPALVNTANGVMEVGRGRAETLEVGNIAMRDIAVHLAPNDDLDVIGMNFLSKLSRWSVEGRWLILTA